jgi:DNA polymerase I-like protein with 3'-5' exonuclease and polymerase domains
LEVQETNLSTLGDGSIRKDGTVICVGLYDGRDYVCCKPDDPRLKDWLASDEDKCFHNYLYDVAWLHLGLGYEIGGRWHDTICRAGLIDEFMDLSLDSCCKRFGVKGKNKEDTIEAWFNDHKQQWGLRGSVWNNLDVISYFPTGWDAIEKYNRQDCKATHELFYATEPFMNDVREVYDMECELFPLWIAMRNRGIRIDVPRMDRLQSMLLDLRTLQEQQMWHEYQVTPEIIASNKQMTVAMHRLGVHSPNLTATGGESWDVRALPLIDHPVVKMISNYKNLDYIIGNKGIENIRHCMVGDRLHPIFKPTKRDEGGALTARLSCSAPNCQNWPSREEAYGEMAFGPEIRSLVLPEEGMMLAAPDYGQIETRMMAHYAVGKDAEWFRNLCKDPKVDLHAEAMSRTGIESRYVIKRLNFGIPFGMSGRRMVALDYPMFLRAANKMGYSDPYQYGEVVYKQFKQGFPVLFDMMANIENTVKTQGYILSLGGRRHHAPRPVLNKNGRYGVPYYQCTAHVISGSAADVLKRGILTAYKHGIFDTLPFALTVHDENVVSVPFSPVGVDALQALIEDMRGAYSEKLTVPLTISCEAGANWGVWRKDIYKAMVAGDFNPDMFNWIYAKQVKERWWCIRNGYQGLDGQLTVVGDDDNTQ